MAFKFEKTGIPGVITIRPQVFGDERGCFLETFKAPDFAAVGIPTEFAQDNESTGTRGVLRGLHFQREHTQGKLIRVVHGEVFDVAVDVRPQSPTFGQWAGVTLSDKKKNMIWIPQGFAHGFLVLSESATFAYKCTDVYDPGSEGGIPWNDADIAIQWPSLDIPYKTSEKDGKHPPFKEQSFEWAEKWM